jgi:hypothetical protein
MSGLLILYSSRPQRLALQGFADIWHGSFVEAGNAMYKTIVRAWSVAASQGAAGEIVIDIEE